MSENNSENKNSLLVTGLLKVYGMLKGKESEKYGNKERWM